MNEQMDRVLIVDDDIELCRLLSERLSTEGFALEAVHDGVRGLERVLSREHAFVILDLMLPGMGGLDVLRHLRAQSPVPVLILTARGEDVDRILGLEIGADDYLPKPFNPRELIARIRAILRRTARAPEKTASLTVGDIRLDPAAREVSVDGKATRSHQRGIHFARDSVARRRTCSDTRISDRDRARPPAWAVRSGHRRAYQQPAKEAERSPRR